MPKNKEFWDRLLESAVKKDIGQIFIHFTLMLEQWGDYAHRQGLQKVVVSRAVFEGLAHEALRLRHENPGDCTIGDIDLPHYRLQICGVAVECEEL